MVYLIVSVLLNVLLFSLFKVFPRYKVDNLQAIIVNYIVCVITGSIATGHFPVSSESISQPWLPWSILLGAGFITVFNLIAYCIRMDGLTTSTIANKLSLVIPVLFSVFLYEENMGLGKICGILLAIPAVWLSSSGKDPQEHKKKTLLLPVLLFLGSGLLDTLVKYSEHRFLETEDQQTSYIIHTFLAAACVGLLLISFLLLTGKRKFHWKNILAGVLLGVPNYFSLVYLVKLLHSGFFQSSAAIPVNNIGIVLLSTVVALSLFGERLSVKKVAGIFLSIAAILLIALSDIHGRT